MLVGKPYAFLNALVHNLVIASNSYPTQNFLRFSPFLLQFTTFCNRFTTFCYSLLQMSPENSKSTQIRRVERRIGECPTLKTFLQLLRIRRFGGVEWRHSREIVPAIHTTFCYRSNFVSVPPKWMGGIRLFATETGKRGMHTCSPAVIVST